VKEEENEFLRYFGRAVIILLIVGVVFFGLIVGMCGFRPFS